MNIRNIAKYLKEKQHPIFIFFLSVTPFFYFYQIVLVGFSFSRVIGADFIPFYYNYRVYLLDFLSNGKFPLWNPFSAGGFPFYSDPFSAAFYPLNIMLLISYKLFGGLSRYDYELFTIFGLSIFILGLYFWFRSLNFTDRIAFASAFVMGISFKITETLRYANSVHTIAWFPWILYGLTIGLTKNRYIKSFLVISMGLIMTITAVYPYFVYYGIFLFPIYILLLLIPFTRNEILQIKISAHLKKYLVLILVSFCIPLLICLPYIINVQKLMTQTYNRGGGNLDWSASAGSFSSNDTIGSLVYPPLASIEGWYYFGIINTFFIVFFIAISLVKPKKYIHNFRIFLIIALWFEFITEIAYGPASPVFMFFWTFLPGFSSLRAWARITILFTMIIGILVARSYATFEEFVKNGGLRKLMHARKWLLLILFNAICIYIITFQIHIYRTFHFETTYWQIFFTYLHVNKIFYIYAGIISLFVINTLILITTLFPKQSLKKYFAFLCVILAVTVWDVGSVGNRQWTDGAPSDTLTRSLYHLPQVEKTSFNLPRINAAGVRYKSGFGYGIAQDWFYARYVTFWNRYYIDINTFRNAEEVPYFNALMGSPSAHIIFFSRKLSYQTVRSFITDTQSFDKESTFNYKLLQYNGDDLKILVRTRELGYVDFIDTWDSDWEVFVDGKQKNIELLFHFAKSVKIPKGKHIVEFIYKPKIFLFF